jgi:hypothetical protein
MRFVEKINLVAITGWGVARGVAQFPDFIDAAVGGGVDFDYIKRIACADLFAGVANSAGFKGWPLRAADFVAAIERHGQNPGDGGFADAAMSAEDIPMSDSLLLEGVAQGASHMILAGDVGESLRAVFAG